MASQIIIMEKEQIKARTANLPKYLIMVFGGVMVLAGLLIVTIKFSNRFGLIKTRPFETVNIHTPLNNATANTTTAQIVSSGTSTLPVIMYHYVEIPTDPNDHLRKSMSIAPAIFEKQLRSLQQYDFQTYFMSEVARVLSAHEKMRTPGVALTFDDGYEDFYTDAFPLIKKYRTKATIYLMYDYLGKPGYLTVDQVKEMVSSGLVEIGSHTLDHVDLSKSSAIDAWRQISENKSKLEQEFSVSVASFAYPYGKYNVANAEQAKAAGYTDAVTVNSGAAKSESALFELPRLRAGKFVGRDMGKELKAWK